MTEFIAIDVETANPNMASICQIGIAKFSGEQLVEEWSTLLDPESYFEPVNIRVHGIEPHMVVGQPKLPDVAAQLRRLMSNTVSVCHTHFDKTAMYQAFSRYGLSPVDTLWLDSARVARRTWPEMAWQGYGLKHVCHKIGYQFKHHDALEDAKAAGFVMLAAMQESGHSLDEWLNRVEWSILGHRPEHAQAIPREGNPEGDLYGEVLVFTGELQIPRDAAAEMAAQVGCRIAANVTKKTTILVVGDQDVTKLAGHEKSSKHRKAEELSMSGAPIRIIQERDFQQLVTHAKSKPMSSLVME